MLIVLFLLMACLLCFKLWFQDAPLPHCFSNYELILSIWMRCCLVILFEDFSWNFLPGIINLMCKNTDHVLCFTNLLWMQLPLKFLLARLCKWGSKWQIFASTFCIIIVNFAPQYHHLDSLFFLRLLSFFLYTPSVYMFLLLIIYLIPSL